MEAKEPAKSTQETRPYWDGIAAGKLMLNKCHDCGSFHHYPRSICPFCFSGNTSFEEVAGSGIVYSYSIMRRAEKPYVLAYVSLSEGVCIMTNIVGCDPDSVRIGMSVNVVFCETDAGILAPMFAPSTETP